MRRGFRARVLARERLVGTVLSLPGAAYAELVGGAFDFVWIDLEHGALGLSDMQDAVIGAQAAGCAALARVPLGQPLAPCLDAAVDGVVVPRVESPEAAAELTSSLRYPPAGSRGFGPRRLALRGDRCQRPACVVQVESPAGLRECAAIAAVSGVDAVVAGAADLSYELGAEGDAGAPVVAEAIRAACEATLSAGKAFGVAGVSSWPLDGASLLTVGSDIRLIAAALHAVAGPLATTRPESANG